MTHVRTLVHHGSKVFWALMAVALAFTLTSNAADANHTPANKVVADASIDDIEFVTPEQDVPILRQKLRTSRPADLLLQVSSECSIVTDVVTNGNESSAARGKLSYYLEIATEGGATRRVGVQETSGPANTGGEDDDGEVIFCDRTYGRDVENLGETNTDDARIRTYMDTRNANAFNWLAFNVGSGVHTVTLYANYDNALAEDSEFTTNSDSSSQGVVGRRTLIIEPVRAPNDESSVSELAVQG